VSSYPKAFLESAMKDEKFIKFFVKQLISKKDYKSFEEIISYCTSSFHASEVIENVLEALDQRALDITFKVFNVKGIDLNDNHTLDSFLKMLDENIFSEIEKIKNFMGSVDLKQREEVKNKERQILNTLSLNLNISNAELQSKIDKLGLRLSTESEYESEFLLNSSFSQLTQLHSITPDVIDVILSRTFSNGVTKENARTFYSSVLTFPNEIIRTFMRFLAVNILNGDTIKIVFASEVQGNHSDSENHGNHYSPAKNIIYISEKEISKCWSKQASFVHELGHYILFSINYNPFPSRKFSEYFSNDNLIIKYSNSVQMMPDLLLSDQFQEFLAAMREYEAGSKKVITHTASLLNGNTKSFDECRSTLQCSEILENNSPILFFSLALQKSQILDELNELGFGTKVLEIECLVFAQCSEFLNTKCVDLWGDKQCEKFSHIVAKLESLITTKLYQKAALDFYFRSEDQVPDELDLGKVIKLVVNKTFPNYVLGLNLTSDENCFLERMSDFVRRGGGEISEEQEVTEISYIDSKYHELINRYYELIILGINDKKIIQAFEGLDNYVHSRILPELESKIQSHKEACLNEHVVYHDEAMCYTPQVFKNTSLPDCLLEEFL
jgi:hypothetical protein